MPSIPYNTDVQALAMPKYGRYVQTLVQQAVATTDADERQALAKRIVQLMAQLNPQMRSTPNYQHTLWNHLARMSNYQLDVDYPCPIEQEQQGGHPAKLSYPGHNIRLRHYGHLVESALQQIAAMSTGDEGRPQAVKVAAACMVRNLAERGHNGHEAETVAHDVEAYTNGSVSHEEVLSTLETISWQSTPQYALKPYRKGGFGKR